MIHVSGLTKTYTYFEQDAAANRTIHSLFHREKLYKEAVKGVSFDVEAGEIIGFIGPNGAGKTTTLKMLCGILYPTGGKATVMGYVPWERRKEYKLRFSIVMGQKAQLWGDLPAADSLRLNQVIYEVAESDYRQRVGELCEMLDVAHLMKIQVRRLSLGERMKFELIAALLHKPLVLFLDEPTIGLDLTAQMAIRGFLREYNRQTGAAIVLTSHYMRDIEDLCERAVLIQSGKLIFDDRLANLNRFIGDKTVFRLRGGTPPAKELRALVGEGPLIEENKIIAAGAQAGSVLAALLTLFAVDQIETDELSLEEGIALLYAHKGGAS